MGLDLPHGGHLSHGFQTDTKKISAVSVFFETFPYRLNEQTGVIDYDRLAENAKLYRPKLIIAGASAYVKHIDYARMREIANASNAYLLSDMAHIAGMVAAGLVPSPFDHSDIVTTTTHKTLRGPRGAMIFFRKGENEHAKPIKSKTGGPSTQPMYDLENKINFSVFPGLQGGPHNHTIAAIATALKQAKTEEYKQYQAQVLKNSKALATCLMDTYGYKLVSNGTENHMLVVDVMKSVGLNGAKVERVLELANIAVNKNTVPGDVSAMNPGGIRMGTPAVTTRGLTEEDITQVAAFFHEACQITRAVEDSPAVAGVAKQFRAALADPAVAYAAYPAIKDLQDRVAAFSRTFPTIGQ